MMAHGRNGQGQYAVLLRALLVLVLVCAANGCQEKANHTTFKYSARDASESPLTRGSVRIRLPEGDGVVTGEWDIERVASVPDEEEFAEKYGPQVGTGGIRGEMTDDGDTLILLLLPQVIDNEVYLVLTRDGDNWVGQWKYYTDAGLTASGAAELIIEQGE